MENENMTENNKILIELVKENPDLPIITATYYEVCAGDYGYWFGDIEEIKVDHFYLDGEKWYAGDCEIIEHLSYEYENENECELMTDEQFDSFLDKKFKELIQNGKIIKAIIIYINL